MAKPDPEWEWKIQLTSLVAEIKANQENMNEKMDAFVGASNNRVDDLEHVVYGNGSEGLAETVRLIKGRWAVMYGLIMIIVASVTQAAARYLLP